MTPSDQPIQNPASNPCVLLHGPQQTSISSTHLPVPDLSACPPDHVLLRIAYIGVCGSDVHFWLHGGVGGDERKNVQYYVSQGGGRGVGAESGSKGEGDGFEGLVMGHEASATVEGVGEAVDGLVVGDRVAVEPGVPCWRCERCVEGVYNLCSGMRFAASFYEGDEVDNSGGGGTKDRVVRATPGCLSKYYVLPKQLCYKLPERVGLDEGVFVEPLAVAVHAVRMAEVGRLPGHRDVVVSGAGTIGLLSAAVACTFGARKVVLVDVNVRRLEFAKRWLGGDGGAADRAGCEVLTFESQAGLDAVVGAKRLRDECVMADGADVVLEASGVPSAIALGVHALRTGGHMVQTGLSKKPCMDGFPIVDLSEKEIHLHGAFRYKWGDFEVARDLLGSGLVGRVKELIGKVFAFEQYEEAWRATRDGKGIKNIIQGVQ